MSTEASLDILGAGGHAKVVVDALLTLGWTADRIRVRDDRRELEGSLLQGCRVWCPVLPSEPPRERLVHAAVGSAMLRLRWLHGTGLAHKQWHTIIHPHASVARSSSVGPGCFVAARAVIGPDATLGESCIINHGAVVDHDCRVGAFCHVAPGAVLGGAVHLGVGVLVGAGAVILPGTCVGEHAVVGAGAVVAKDVSAGATVTGIPAIARSEHS